MPLTRRGSYISSIDMSSVSVLIEYRYVHANYRFMVDPKGDYHVQAGDADVHLDWSAVLQILASSQTQCSACPICLSTPVAPRMAKCGHIFCLPCLIRYMHSTDEISPIPEKKARWKKCPICWDSIYVSETRPVRWFTGQEGLPPREGDDIVLRLVMRQPGSTLALPRDGADGLAQSDQIPWHFAAEVADYARIMKASEDYMVSQFDAEIEQLQLLEREDELIYGDEPEWTKKAVSAIREAKERVTGIGNPPTMPEQAPKNKPSRPPIKFNETDDGVPDMYTVQHAVQSGQSSSGGTSTPLSQPPRSPAIDTNDTRSNLVSDRTPETDVTSGRASGHDDRRGSHSVTNGAASSSYLRSIRDRPVAGTSQPNEYPYYFYQALLHYYLSPLDIRILKAAFGNFASFPSTILPRVEHVSTGHIVDDELRKRAKYLGHLPHGCEVGFLECNWTDVVAPEILEKFRFEIERRRKKNQDKEMREEKERVRAERLEEDERWASARRRRPDVPRESLSEDDFGPLTSSSAVNGSSSVDISGSSASPPWASSSRHQHGSAFASLASPSTSPVAARTVWGTSAIIPTSPPTRPVQQLEADSAEHDGWLQGWEQDLLHEDDLVAQVQAASVGESSTTGAAQGGAGKKKKGKKITLMSTNARRGA